MVSYSQGNAVFAILTDCTLLTKWAYHMHSCEAYKRTLAYDGIVAIAIVFTLVTKVSCYDPWCMIMATLKLF